jgi:hypothetical protein
VLTGGTIVDGSMLTDDMSNHCVAIKVRCFSAKKESENSAVEASRTQTPNEGGDVGVGVSSCKERQAGRSLMARCSRTTCRTTVLRSRYVASQLEATQDFADPLPLPAFLSSLLRISAPSAVSHWSTRPTL